MQVRNCTNNRRPNQIAASYWMRSSTVYFQAWSIAMPSKKYSIKLIAAMQNISLYYFVMLDANFGRCTAIGRKMSRCWSCTERDPVKSMNLCSISFSSELSPNHFRAFFIFEKEKEWKFQTNKFFCFFLTISDTTPVANAFRKSIQNIWPLQLMPSPFIIRCGKGKRWICRAKRIWRLSFKMLLRERDPIENQFNREINNVELNTNYWTKNERQKKKYKNNITFDECNTSMSTPWS